MNLKKELPLAFKAIATIEYWANLCRWCFGILTVLILYITIKDFLVFRNTYFPVIESGKLVLVGGAGSVNDNSIAMEGNLINQPKDIRRVIIGSKSRGKHKNRKFYSSELKNKQRGDTISVWYVPNSDFTRVKLEIKKRELYDKEYRTCLKLIIFTLIIFFSLSLCQ
jgi:hypothetical protein